MPIRRSESQITSSQHTVFLIVVFTSIICKTASDITDLVSYCISRDLSVHVKNTLLMAVQGSIFSFNPRQIKSPDVTKSHIFFPSFMVDFER